MSNSLTYKEISKLLDLVETEIFKLESRQKKESSFHVASSIIDSAKGEDRPMEWEVEDKRLDADMALLVAIKDKINQLFERINFTFGVDNNRFNQPKQETAPNGQ